jgi:hypothetical protein
MYGCYATLDAQHRWPPACTMRDVLHGPELGHHEPGAGNGPLDLTFSHLVAQISAGTRTGARQRSCQWASIGALIAIGT